MPTPTPTPLDEFIARLRQGELVGASDFYTPRHSHILEGNPASDQHFKCDAKCDRPVTLPGGLADILVMSLDRFEREGQPIEIRVPWWPETLFFVPSVRDAQALSRENVARHRVWAASELSTFLGALPLTTESLLMVTVARQEFDGEVVGVRPRGEA